MNRHPPAFRFSGKSICHWLRLSECFDNDKFLTRPNVRIRASIRRATSNAEKPGYMSVIWSTITCKRNEQSLQPFLAAASRLIVLKGRIPFLLSSAAGQESRNFWHSTQKRPLTSILVAQFETASSMKSKSRVSWTNALSQERNTPIGRFFFSVAFVLVKPLLELNQPNVPIAFLRNIAALLLVRLNTCALHAFALHFVFVG